MHRTRIALFAPLALALIGATAACGSASTGTKSAASTPPAAPAQVSPPTPSSAPVTKAHLLTLGVQAADFPAGWTAGSTQTDDTEAADSQQLAACLGAKDTYPDRVGTGQSPDYTSGDYDVSSEIAAYPSSADVDSDVAAMLKPTFDACLKKLVTAGLAKQTGFTLRSLSTAEAAGSNGGPSNVVATDSSTVSYVANGTSGQFVDTQVLIRGARLEATLDLESMGGPIPSALQKQLTNAVAARVAQG